MSTTISGAQSGFNFPMLHYNGLDDIVTASSDEYVQKNFSEITHRFSTINVKEAMTDLTQVGSMLQLAYAGTKGFPCCAKVLSILGKYQSLVKDSFLASEIFVTTSLEALRAHRVALLFAAQEKDDAALTMLSKTAKVAEKMVAVCGELVGKSKDLCSESMSTLVAAAEDESVTGQKKAAVLLCIANLEAKEASLKVITEALAADVADLKNRQVEAVKEKDTSRKHAFVISFITSVMNPLVNVASTALTSTVGQLSIVTSALGLGNDKGAASSNTSALTPHETQSQQAQEANIKANKDLRESQNLLAVKKQTLASETDVIKKKALDLDIASIEVEVQCNQKVADEQATVLEKLQGFFNTRADRLEDKEAQIAKQRAEVQKELRESNADLAESIVRLRSSQVEDNRLDEAMNSLEVAVKTLGKVKTVFENARVYWMSVQRQCESLSNIDQLQDAKLVTHAEFIDAVKESGLNWLAFGSINHAAASAMKNVNAHVDNIMTDLPTKSESMALVLKVSSEMLQQLEIEKQKLAPKESNTSPAVATVVT